MKKIVIILGMIGVLTLLATGCGNVESDNQVVQDIKEEKNNTNTDILTIAPDQIIKNVQFNPETDNLNYLSSPDMAVTETGYYFFKDLYLYYRDKVNGRSFVVCTQVNCDHSTDQCDGYFDISYFRTEQGLWYYDNQLYFLGNKNGLKNYVLYRVNLDGTGRELVMDLFTLEGEEDAIKSITLHRGCLYYALETNNVSGEMSDALFQVDLKRKTKPSELYHTNIERSYIYRIKGYGDGVFFQIGEYRDVEYTDFHASLWYCDDEGTALKILDEVWKDYNIIDEMVYYTTDTVVNRYDWNSQKMEVFVDLGRVCNISYDDSYIYLDDYYGVLFDDRIDTSSRQIYVLDRSGKILKKWNIPLSESDICLFGDENYLWLNRYMNVTNESQGEGTLYAFSKADILSETDDWQKWN